MTMKTDFLISVLRVRAGAALGLSNRKSYRIISARHAAGSVMTASRHFMLQRYAFSLNRDVLTAISKYGV